MDFKGASTPMSPNDLYYELIYHDDVYESWIDFEFILVHKGVLVIT